MRECALEGKGRGDPEVARRSRRTLRCLSVISCRRSQDVEQAVGGLPEVGRTAPGAVADDVEELGRARHPDPVGGPGPEETIVSGAKRSVSQRSVSTSVS